jgi:hypothetical protein
VLLVDRLGAAACAGCGGSFRGMSNVARNGKAIFGLQSVFAAKAAVCHHLRQDLCRVAVDGQGEGVLDIAAGEADIATLAFAHGSF